MTSIDGVDVDSVAAAVRGCAAVDDLYSTPAATVASYLPGRQVAGVRIGTDSVTVQVRSRWAIPVQDVVAQIRDAVLPLVAGRRVDVVIADITDAPESAPAALPSSSESEVAWTSSTAEPPGANTSGPITPTEVATPPSS